ncbi:hypothetical protein ACSBR2_026785 [Camellia fascicularis]
MFGVNASPINECLLPTSGEDVSEVVIGFRNTQANSDFVSNQFTVLSMDTVVLKPTDPDRESTMEISHEVVANRVSALDPMAVVADRFARFKSPESSVRVSSTPDKPRWSDAVPDDQHMFQNLPDSIVVTRNRSEARAREEGLPLPLGPSFNCLDNQSVPTPDPVDSGENLVTNNTSEVVREEFQTRRGGISNFRGGRGGRGRGGIRENDTPAKTWAEVAAPSTRSTIPLRYVPPTLNEGYVSVELPPRLNPLEKWDSCLVGYFLDRGVSYNYMRNSAFGLWKNKGLKEIQSNGQGFWFFIFEDPGCCNSVLEGGPWYIGGFNLILKKWKRMMKLTKEKVTKVPVWVKFFNVPLEYWDSDGLSRIASAVGQPLFMDNLTEQGSRVAFARVCVEVEVTTKCVKSQVEKLVGLQKETEDNPDPGWSTVKAKGKRKVGDSNPSGPLADGGADDVVFAEGEHGNNSQQDLAQVSSSESPPRETRDTESNLHRGEINPSLDGLALLQKEVLELTRIALPDDTEMISKVENLIAANPGHSTPPPKMNQKVPAAKGSSSGKGKSQRKKQR